MEAQVDRPRRTTNCLLMQHSANAESVKRGKGENVMYSKLSNLMTLGRSCPDASAEQAVLSYKLKLFNLFLKVGSRGQRQGESSCIRGG